jgi:hypothetical protein
MSRQTPSRLRRTAATLLLVLFTGVIRPEDTNALSSNDFSSFRIIAEKNIFNPNRSAHVERGDRATPARAVTVESFTLNGTLAYEKGRFAFFEGSSPAYRKSLKPDEKIAGFQIKDIAYDHVTLETNGQSLEMKVGMQMKRENEGEWQLAARSEASAPAGASSQTVESEEAESPSGSGENDVLKRLLQKREEENKK